MALIEIEYGSLASSSTMNNNFSYLDNRINSCNEGIISIQNNVSSLNSTLSQSIENIKNELDTTIGELQTQVNTLETNTSINTLGVSLAPDYSNAISITLPYTVTANGYVYARIYTGDSVLGVFVNGQPVLERSSSQYGGITAQGSSIFKVSDGDYITTNGSLQIAKFYPLKGV